MMRRSALRQRVELRVGDSWQRDVGQRRLLVLDGQQLASLRRRLVLPEPVLVLELVDLETSRENSTSKLCH